MSQHTDGGRITGIVRGQRAQDHIQGQPTLKMDAVNMMRAREKPTDALSVKYLCVTIRILCEASYCLQSIAACATSVDLPQKLGPSNNTGARQVSLRTAHSMNLSK